MVIKLDKAPGSDAVALTNKLEQPTPDIGKKAPPHEFTAVIVPVRVIKLLRAPGSPIVNVKSSEAVLPNARLLAMGVACVSVYRMVEKGACWV